MSSHVANKTSFKKGHIPEKPFSKGNVPWNKGLVGIQAGEKAANWKGGLPDCKECGKQLSQRHSKTNQCMQCFLTDPSNKAIAISRLAKIDNTGDNNWLWKGKNVGYFALHHWVNRQLGKPQECVYCGKGSGENKLQWANVSHEYKRDLSDFISLCIPCHKNYDTSYRRVGY